MRNYYILFNYTNQSVGFNGNYYNTEAILDKPDAPKGLMCSVSVLSSNKVPLWGLIIISSGLVGIILSICVCLYIRQKNKSLNEHLANYDQLENGY